MEPWKNQPLNNEQQILVDWLRGQEQITSPEQQQASERLTTESVKMEATFALFAMEKAFQRFLDKRITIDDELKAEAINNFAPLLVKYGLAVPQWMAQYEEEIMALKSLGTIGFNVYEQKKQLMKQDRLNITAQSQQEAA